MKRKAWSIVEIGGGIGTVLGLALVHGSSKEQIVLWGSVLLITSIFALIVGEFFRKK